MPNGRSACAELGGKSRRRTGYSRGVEYIELTIRRAASEPCGEVPVLLPPLVASSAKLAAIV
jgi:hypothetical protein